MARHVCVLFIAAGCIHDIMHKTGLKTAHIPIDVTKYTMQSTYRWKRFLATLVPSPGNFNMTLIISIIVVIPPITWTPIIPLGAGVIF